MHRRHVRAVDGRGDAFEAVDEGPAKKCLEHCCLACFSDVSHRTLLWTDHAYKLCPILAYFSYFTPDLPSFAQNQFSSTCRTIIDPHPINRSARDTFHNCPTVEAFMRHLRADISVSG